MSNGQHTLDTQSLAADHGTVASAPAPLNDIDQVRDLLFGGQQREADRRFRTTDRRLDEVTAALQRLADRADRERAEGQTLAREQTSHMQARIDELQAAFQNKLRDQQREFDLRFDRLQAQVTEMFDALDSNKLDQEDMSDILIDMAKRLKRAKQAPTTES